MRYMVFVKMAEDVGNAPRQLHEAMDAALQEAFADGSMIDAGGLYPTAQSTEVRLTGGRVVITDGPYSEAKEHLAGFFLIDVESQERAEEIASQFASPGDTVELRATMWPGGDEG